MAEEYCTNSNEKIRNDTCDRCYVRAECLETYIITHEDILKEIRPEGLDRVIVI